MAEESSSDTQATQWQESDKSVPIRETGINHGSQPSADSSLGNSSREKGDKGKYGDDPNSTQNPKLQGSIPTLDNSSKSPNR